MNLSRYNGVLILIVLIVVYSVWLPDTFPTTTTLRTVLSNQAVTGIAALGLVCALSVGAFDLSVATVIGLSSTAAASLMIRDGVSPGLTILIVLAIGLSVGLVNGLLIVRFRIPSIVATLGTSSIVLAFDNKLTNGQFITPVPKSFAELTSNRPAGIPVPFLVLVVITVLIWYVLEHTPLGRRMIATGAGTDAARLAGTNTGLMVYVGLMISATLASLAGLILLSTVGTAAPGSGPPYLLPLFAAVYLGSTQIKPGRFNVWGTIVALYVLAVGVKGLQLAGGQYWVAELFNGVALILAVGIAVAAQQGRGFRGSRFRVGTRRTASDSA